MKLNKKPCDIAIVGVSCRLPGAKNFEAYCDLLTSGRNSMRRFTPQELEQSGVTKSEYTADNYVPVSGYLDDVDQFDAELFHFTRREAEICDPQLRKLLECSYEALEDAGLLTESLDARIGVFTTCGMALYAGNNLNTYHKFHVSHHKDLLQHFDHLQVMTLNEKDWVPTNISYRLDLRGPSMNVQTACSSSLVALKLAIDSLQQGDCEVAVAGAAAIHFPTKRGYHASEGSIFSPTGVCRPFAADADGTVGGSGVGVVVLRPLGDALRDGDEIYGVIKGIAINNDGARKSSFMAPSPEGQAETLEEAIEQSAIPADQITLVEAHGTGTKLGDPIEVRALTRIFRKSTDKQRYCALGSVKSNIGHLDTAAGMASLLKVLVAMRTGQIPATLGFDAPNPMLKLDASPFYVNSANVPWTNPGTPVSALISSLGAGGTNAALVLQSHVEIPAEPISTDRQEIPFVLSARSLTTLRAYAEKYRNFLTGSAGDISAICQAAALHRRHYEARLAITAKSRQDLIKGLDDFLAEAVNSQVKFGFQKKLKKKGAAISAFEASALAQLYCEGEWIDWKAVFQAVKPKTKIPGYPFDSKSFLLAPEGRPAETPVIGNSFQVLWKEIAHPANASEKIDDICILEYRESPTDEALVEFAAGKRIRLRQESLECADLETDLLVFSGIGIPDAPYRFLKLLQKLANGTIRCKRLLVLTQESDGETAVPSSAGLMGMISCARVELPAVAMCCVDLDSAKGLGIILDNLSSLVHRDLRVQAERWLERHLISLKQEPISSFDLTEQDTVLVTGGCGGLGLETAQFLVDSGCSSLVLVHRSDASSRALDHVGRWRSQGVRVALVQAALGEGQLHASLLAQGIKPQSITGVFHLAGTIQDRTLENLQADDLHRVCQPKLDGLQEVLALLDDPGHLRFVVCFSSVVALLGNPGQVNYGAANAFLNAQVEALYSRGIPAYSINWGAWLKSGMAQRTIETKTAHVSPLLKHGISSELAFQELKQVLSSQPGLYAIVHNEFRLIDRDVLTLAEASQKLWGSPRSEMKVQGQQPLSLPEIQRRLQELLQDVLGRGNISLDEKFMDVGLDSLGIVSLANGINSIFSARITTSSVYSFPTIGLLAQKIHSTISSPALERQKSTDEETGKVMNLESRDQNLQGKVAIVGVGCRLPGGIEDIESLWNALSNEVSLIREIPESRFSIASCYRAEKGQKGSMYVKHGAFLEQISRIVPGLFSVSPNVAKEMDPQHLLLLETAASSIENAGFSSDYLQAVKTGVYVGMGSDDFSNMVFQNENKGDINGDRVLGANRAVGVGRLSYAFGWTGPAISIDTACSSSLVAVHLAAQGLLIGDCDVALAGGVHLILSSENMISRCQLGVLASDGVHRAFDEDSKGFVQGEGCGLVVLRRLEDAVRDRDQILAVIDASAVNQNGSGNGIQAPNSIAQKKLIQDCLHKARLKSSDIAYVETHGTGTFLGDPIEFDAIAETYGQHRSETLYIGSVKTNFGHLEPAAGILSLIKAVTILDKKIIPPQLHFKRPNSNIRWADSPIEVVTRNTPLPLDKGLARIAVSSFGIGGTNAHAILSRYVPVEASRDRTSTSYLVPLSAATGEGLVQSARCLLDELQSPSSIVADVAFSRARVAQANKAQVCFQGQTKQELIEAATAFLAAGKKDFTPGRMAFVYSGQGSQVEGMGRAFYERYPVFKKSLDACHELYQKATGQDLIALMFRGSEQEINETRHTQPLLFAFQYGLQQLLVSWGLLPDALLGHSVGEFSACVHAGVLSLEDGFNLVIERGRLMGSLPGDGGMLALNCDSGVAEDVIAESGLALEISGINSASSTIVSGRRTELALFQSLCTRKAVRSLLLPVSHAFHSSMMEPILDKWRTALMKVRFQSPMIPIISNVNGRPVESFDPEYWVRHLRQAVQFKACVETLKGDGFSRFLDIGPRPILQRHLQSLVPGALVLSVSEPQGEEEALKRALGQLFNAGVPCDWNSYAKDEPGRTSEILRPGVAMINCENTLLEKHKKGLETVSNATPSTPINSQLADIKQHLISYFAKVLGYDAQSINVLHNFFQLGADSFVMVAAVNMVQQQWQIRISIKDIFEKYTSIEALSRRIHEVLGGTVVAPAATAIPAAPVVSCQPVEAKPELVKPTLNAAASNVVQEQVAPMKLPKFTSQPAGVPAAGESPAEKSSSDEAQSPQSRYLAAFAEKYNAKTAKSKQRAQADKKHLCNNRRSSSGFRLETKELAYPIIASKSQGSKFEDIDGNKYIDLAMGYGACFFGHNPAHVKRALAATVEQGYQIGPEADLAGENARMIAEMTQFDRVVFTNSGTEAVMTAIRIARTARGKEKIVIFKDSYHGHFDEALVIPDVESTEYAGRPMFAGIPSKNLGNVIVLPYSQNSIAAIAKYADELAAVVVEPVQNRRPDYHPAEFLKNLRQITQDHGIILIFDEILVGFRIALGGAQEHFGVRADMATYGKVVGGGLPLGVIAGKASIMDHVDGGQWKFGDQSGPSVEQTYTAGTFCKHPLSMAACHATLKELLKSGKSLHASLNLRTDRLKEILNQIFAHYKVPVEVVNFGSFFRFAQSGNLSFTLQPLELDIFFYHLIERGVYVWEGRTCFISTEHSDADIDAIIEAADSSVRSMVEAGFWLGGNFPGGGMPIPKQPSVEQNEGKSILGRAVTNQAPVAKAKSTATLNPYVLSANPPHSVPTNDDFLPKKASEAIDFSLYYFGNYGQEQSEDIYEFILKGAKFADQNAFRALWLPERHFNSFGGFSPNPAVLGAAVVRETKNLQLRASVLAPLHNPARIVEDWAMVDQLSKGRVGMALASGWHANDFILNPEAWGKNKEELLARLPIIQKLWKGETLSFAGSNADVPVSIYPRPFAKSLPMWLTTLGNPETYELAGRQGLGILTNLLGQTKDEVAALIKIYKKGRQDAGLDPEKGHVTMLLHTFLHEDLETAREIARAPFCAYLESSIGLFQKMVSSQNLAADFSQISKEDKDFILNQAYRKFVDRNALIGTVASCREVIDELNEIGVNEIACFVDFGISPEQGLASLQWLGKLKESCRLSGSGQNQSSGTPESFGFSKDQLNLKAAAQFSELGESLLNESIALRIDGDLCLPTLRLAYKKLCDHHSALRLKLDMRTESLELHQDVQQPIDLIPIEEALWSNEDALKDLVQAQTRIEFKSGSFPHRISLFQSPESPRTIVLVTCSHMICDGMGTGIFVEDLFSHYNQLKNPNEGFSARASNFHEVIGSKDTAQGTAAQKDFWASALQATPAAIALPYREQERPKLRTYAAESVSIKADSDLVGRIKAASRQANVSYFGYLFSAFAALLRKVSQQDCFRVGIAFHGRSQVEDPAMIGYCCNVYPVGIDLSGVTTFEGVTNMAWKSLLAANGHQDLSYSELLSLIAKDRARSQNALYSVAFNLDKIELPVMSAAQIRYFPVDKFHIKSDLKLDILEMVGEMSFIFEYNTALLDRGKVQAIADEFVKLLHEILPKSVAEEVRLPEGEPVMFPARIDRCAQQNPQGIAISDLTSQLSFKELKERTDAFCMALARQGVKPGDIIALEGEKVCNLVVALIGIQKLGCTCLHMDTKWPDDRKEYVLKDSSAQWIISMNGKPAKDLPGCKALDLEQLLQSRDTSGYRGPEVQLDSYAYIMYTSGSTGVPKAVGISQRNLMNLSLGVLDFFAQEAIDIGTFGWFAPFGFDQTWVALVCLAQGSHVVLVPDAVKANPRQAVEFMKAKGITVFHLTPGLAKLLIDEDSTLSLPTVLVGGEPISKTFWQQLAHHYSGRSQKAVNMYGLTECAVESCLGVVEGLEPMIGKPIKGTRIYIADEKLQILKQGETGEIIIAGDSVFRDGIGQVRNPNLVQLPGHPTEKGIVYRSGDLGRIHADGRVECFGRIDRQVKKNGYRIELKEIEFVIGAHPHVEKVFVHVVTAASGSRQICAWIRWRGAPALEAVMDLVQKKLPPYMHPDHIVPVESFPLSYSGKVDVKGLPSPWSQTVSTDDSSQQVLLKVLEICSDLLKVKVGERADFFMMGGDSLLLMKLLARAYDEFGVEISIRSFLLNATAKGLAEAIEAGTKVVEYKL